MDKYRSLISELRDAEEVRDVVVSTIKKDAATLGKFSTCSESESKDIEKTVRRMFAASSTIGSSLRKVTMHLGGSALVAYALNAEDNLILLIESEADIARLKPLIEKFRAAARAES